MRRLTAFLPALSMLVACVSPPPAPPAPARAMPEPIYTEVWLAPSRGIATLRPAAIEHVMGLDGQRCERVDLRLRCQTAGALPPLTGQPLSSPDPTSHH